MKQEILCNDCKNNLIEKNVFTPSPKEHVKFTPGKARRNFFCDSCYKHIYVKNKCFALSIWADYGGVPYYPWESEYIDIDGEETVLF